MKVLLIHNKFQHFGGEDAAANAERLLLEARGDQVIQYTRHNDEIKTYNIQKKIEFFPETIYSLRTRNDLNALVKDFEPDVAYIHNIYPLVSPSVYHTLHSLGVPITQVLHDSRPLCVNSICFTHGEVCERCSGGNYLHAVRHQCFRGSHVLSALYGASLALNRMAGMLRKINFICLTEFSKHKMIAAGVPEAQLFVRPNFIDVSRVAPRYEVGEYVAYLGRLPVEKGVWTMVKAFEVLKNIPLKIVGTGPEEAALKRYVSEKNITNIEFLGFKSGEEKWEILKNSKFTVVPSEFYEICPVTILEAYAAGKPVIASDIGGVPYVVRDGRTGFLVEPGSVGDLIEKVQYLAGAPAKTEAMGRYARGLVETVYGPERAYTTLREIFAAVSKNRNAPARVVPALSNGAM